MGSIEPYSLNFWQKGIFFHKYFEGIFLSFSEIFMIESPLCVSARHWTGPLCLFNPFWYQLNFSVRPETYSCDSYCLLTCLLDTIKINLNITQDEKWMKTHRFYSHTHTQYEWKPEKRVMIKGKDTKVNAQSCGSKCFSLCGIFKQFSVLFFYIFIHRHTPCLCLFSAVSLWLTAFYFSTLSV